MKTNCWDARNCGRQPGGHRVAERGACLSATAAHLDGVNGGTNGGRICWQVRTYAQGRPEAPDCADAAGCLSCGFMDRVRREQGPDFCFFPPAADV